jgi:hypothetical protein
MISFHAAKPQNKNVRRMLPSTLARIVRRNRSIVQPIAKTPQSKQVRDLGQWMPKNIVKRPPKMISACLSDRSTFSGQLATITTHNKTLSQMSFNQRTKAHPKQ